MRANSRRIIGRELIGSSLELEGQLHGFIGQSGAGLEFNVYVCFGTLIAADRSVGTRCAVIPQHHVVLNHAEPARFRVLS